MSSARFGFVIVIALLFRSISTQAQDYPNNVHEKTTAPTNARYEIIQSELAARLTFRLDRFTGRVGQLVHTKEDNNSWEYTFVRDLPAIIPPYHPRFQIFTSGIAARHTFLIDTDTGKTWIVTSGKGKNPDGTEYERTVWEPFEE